MSVKGLAEELMALSSSCTASCFSALSRPDRTFKFCNIIVTAGQTVTLQQCETVLLLPPKCTQ